MRLRYSTVFLLLCLLPVTQAGAYSVLSHQAIIDASWAREIKPALLARFPAATEEELREAHAYAYGGAILQDMGYYPFGSHLFSDLVHYVRSGDFVAALLRDAENLNEDAFAIGSVAHYAADNEGHPRAVNRAVPLIYPKLAKKYGAEVTYEDDPKAHLKAEFGFDVIEVARGQYASDAYHDFIGFKVSKPLLERAFQETYSLPLNNLFSDLDRSLGTFRFSVSSLIPEMTKTAWAAKQDDIRKLQAGATRRTFVYRFSRANYHHDWDRNYQRPGPGARFLAWLIRILPKIGPLSALAFKVPPPAAEKLFLGSLDDTMRRYRELIGNLPGPPLVNENFDIGQPTHLGAYRMADETYSKLLEHLAATRHEISPELRADILKFYGDSGEPATEQARALLAALKTQ
jgi:hypothetical protein